MSNKKRYWDYNKTLYFDVEIKVDVNFKGYSVPGKTNGDPLDCYPPEYEEEREILSLHIGDYKIPEAVAKEIIKHAELESDVENTET